MGDWDHFCNWYTKEAVINNSMMDTFVFESLLHQAGISTDAKEGIIGLQGSHILRGECCPPKDCTNVYSHQLSFPALQKTILDSEVIDTESI